VLAELRATGKPIVGSVAGFTTAVQIGSALMKEGPGVFACIEQELRAERTTHATDA
jgi:dihydroorotate dehydrogenase